MPNWATQTRQPTRLPQPLDPAAEMFKCERFACRLPKTQCSNRHRLAQGTIRDGLSDKAVTYGACRGCPVGAAHAKGLPTPANQFAEEVRVDTPESEATPKPYPSRICRSGNHPFQPTTAKERACPACRAKRDGKPKGKPAAARRLPMQPTVSAPPKHGAVPGGIVDLTTAQELLEFAGYQVRLIRTPKGDLLQVL